MKRSLFTKSLKKTLLAVPAAALMLGAAQAGTTVGLNFQAWYYDSGTTPQTVGYGKGYQTTGFPVTAAAFGVPLADWSSADPMDCQSAISGYAAFGGVNTIFAGSLTANVTAHNAWQSGIGEQVAGFNPETVAPGNNEVTWGYLDSNAAQSPSVTVAGLAAKFPNGYVVQTIAANNSATATFANVDLNDGTTFSTESYTNATYFVKGTASDGYDTGNGTVGISDPSDVFTGDTLTIAPELQTSPNRSPLAGFIITDQPVISHDPVGATILSGGNVSLRASVAALPNALFYQWRTNGVPILGANSATYIKTGATTADSANYDLVVTNLYGSAVSATANVLVVPAHAPLTSTWDADLVTTGAQDGSGTWAYGNTNWWNGSQDDYWNPTDSAIFGAGGAAAYTVTLGGNIAANSITFSSGTYTITNTSGETLTLQGIPALTGTANGTITVPVTISTNTLVKAGAGAVTLSGALTGTNVFVSAGTLVVGAKTGGDATYVVTNGATLKIGYSTGGGYANTGLQLYGDGTSATTGLYLKGGTSYNVNNGVVVNGAPTTIRQYGTGLAAFGIFDYNSNPGLSITAAASGSVLDPNIQMVSRGYGMVVTTAVGANTATGDLTANGPLNVAGSGVFKRGTGSLRLNTAALAGNGGLNVQAGTVICGTAGCIGANASLNVSAGATLDFNGTSQMVTNAPALAGTLKMSINKGGTLRSTVLGITDGSVLAYGGNLVVTNIGATPVLGDSFTLFTNSLGDYNYGGSFTSISLPALPNGLAWADTYSLFLDGSIQVIAGSTPPSIVTDLSGATNYAYVGGNGTFKISATGDPTLRYQWWKNGNIPVGTDSPTLTLSGITVGNAGNYSCTVTNNFGSAPSQTNYLQVVVPSAAVTAAIQDVPASFWPLAETTPSTAFDYWNGNNGTQNGSLTLSVSGPVPPTYAGFDAGTMAYQFDGASAYIGLGTGPALSGTTDFTLEAWINTTNTANGMILQQRYTGNGYIGEYEFQINGNGTLYFMVYGSGGYQFSFSSPATARRVNDGKWHHVAAVRSGTYGYLYVDGSQVASASGALQALDPTIQVAIGKDLRDNVSYFNGSMCDVAIYNTALSADRIGAHAAVGVLANAPLVLSRVSGGWVEDSKPAGTPHDGKNLGASWVASNTDINSVTRTGVAQFSSGAQVAIPPDTDFNSPTGTICFWMQTPSPAAGTGMMLVDRRTTNGMVIVLNGQPSGGIDVQYTGNTSFSAGGYVIDGNWHQVVITYDQSVSGNVSVYVDGVLQGSQANTAAWSWPVGQQIELGRSHDTYWQEYAGLMDDFRIYNRVLTPTEIQTIATPATSDTLVDTTALVVRYNFGTAAGVGQGFTWPQVGQLQSSPALDSSAVWTPINTTTATYPFLPPYPVATTNSTLFYRLLQ